MTIYAITSVAGVPRPREGSPGASEGFGTAMRQANSPAPPAGIATRTEIGALLALQEAPLSLREDRARRKTAIIRAAGNVLTTLSQLQLSLTEETQTAERLQERLSTALDDLPQPQDPEEKALLEAVMLRGRLELARRTR